MEDKTIVHFLFLSAFSLAASILKYYSTSSIGVSSFSPYVLGILFLAISLHGLEGPSSSGSGLEKGIGGSVTP